MLTQVCWEKLKEAQIQLILSVQCCSYFWEWITMLEASYNLHIFWNFLLYKKVHLSFSSTLFYSGGVMGTLCLFVMTHAKSNHTQS